MKEFEPSRDFVSQVMRNVREYEDARTNAVPLSSRLLAIKSVRFAVSAGGLLLALANLMRLYFAVFSTIASR